MSVRGKLADQGRQVVDVAPAPYGLPLAAVSDTLGRVHLVDTANMSLLRIIKGNFFSNFSLLKSYRPPWSATRLAVKL